MDDAELREILADHVKWLDGEAGGVRADLQDADLRHAELQGARLDEANLKGARLNVAMMLNADLERAYLQDVDFSSARLLATNFDGAHLTGARFGEADLSSARLRGARLDKADLANVKGLQSLALAGADLSGTRLPEDIAKWEGLAHVAEISKHARTIFLAVVAACVFSWLTIATTTDAALILNSVTTPLPIIQTHVPMAGFYWFAPVILLALYFYLHFYLQSMWEGLASLPARFPDGRALDERAYPWLLVGLVRGRVPLLDHDRPAFSQLKNLFSILSAWVLVPATIALFAGRYWTRHDLAWSEFQIAILALAVTSGAAFYVRMGQTLRVGIVNAVLRLVKVPSMHPRRYAFLFVAVFAVAQVLTLGAIEGAPSSFQGYSHPLYSAVYRAFAFAGYQIRADLRDVELSKKPPSWTGLERNEERTARLALVVPARLEGVDLRHADLSGAFLAMARLAGTDLTGARLVNANLMGDLVLGGADLSNVRASFADFTNADLTGARLNGATLTSSRLLGTSLKNAQVVGTNFGDAQFGSSIWNGDHCSEFAGTCTDVTNVYLYEAGELPPAFSLPEIPFMVCSDGGTFYPSGEQPHILPCLFRN